MKTRNPLSLITVTVLLLLLNSCTVNVHLDGPTDAPQSFERKTDDLNLVREDAIESAQRYGKDNVLVVFDIDNTLMAMEQGLGADQWYDWQKDLSDNDLCNPDNVGNRFAVQGALYFVSAMRNTQEDGPEQVKSIQERGIPVIALTSRGMEYQLQTFRELRRNGYSFVHSAIGDKGTIEKPFIPVKDGRFSLYQDGVFLTAGQHKGQMLKALLTKTSTPLPELVIMIDDKQKNLDAINETMSGLKVAVHSWRYTGEDANVANFDRAEAADQWQQLEASLKQIQQIIGPDNYDLTTAGLPEECRQPSTDLRE